MQKPHAFARYRYREDLFPSLSFRKAYDALHGALGQRKADIEYLRILHLAASTLEAEVQTALDLLLSESVLRGVEQVKALVAPSKPEVPELSAPVVDLESYDALLGREVAS